MQKLKIRMNLLWAATNYQIVVLATPTSIDWFGLKTSQGHDEW